MTSLHVRARSRSANPVRERATATLHNHRPSRRRPIESNRGARRSALRPFPPSADCRQRGVDDLTSSGAEVASRVGMALKRTHTDADYEVLADRRDRNPFRRAPVGDGAALVLD